MSKKSAIYLGITLLTLAAVNLQAATPVTQEATTPVVQQASAPVALQAMTPPINAAVKHGAALPAMMQDPAPTPAPTPTTLNWTHYGNQYDHQRYQNVDQINPSNVGRLKVAWVFHTGVLDQFSSLQVTPIVIDGVMYVTDGHDNVFALNAATGAKIWSHAPAGMAPIASLPLCCGRNNRGVAVGNGKVFYGRLDNVVEALNPATGAVVWSSEIADSGLGYSITLAPQFVTTSLFPQGLVIVGVSAGEFVGRGEVFALDATNGQIAWSTFTAQGPDSWGGNAFVNGGATMWNPPSIDTNLGLLYANTGNAAPDVLGQFRPGDNHFTASIVAMDINTGVIKWSFQEVHHGLWDYDAAQPTVLFDLTKNGVTYPALGHCAKSGQYYILDRRNGNPLYAVTEEPVPTTEPEYQNAAPTQPHSAVEHVTPLTFVRPNDTGVPSAPQYTPPSETEVLIVPAAQGGCEWVPAAYSPRTKFVYTPARYQPGTYKTRPNNNSTVPTPGQNFPETQGSSFGRVLPGSHAFGIWGATNTSTGKIAWINETVQPSTSGMTVAGDLVFYGEDNGLFHAVSAATGANLFTFDANTIPNAGGANGGPVAYVVNGKEYIANPFGGNALERQNFPPDAIGDAIIAFTLP